MIVKGDRIKLVRTADIHTKLQPGSEGVVTGIHRVTGLGEPFSQVSIDWDDGSRLMIVPESGDVITGV